MYKLMHKNDLVLDVDDGHVRVHNKHILPFDLRHIETVKYEHWLNWLKRRLTSISRTYMNQLYKQRRLGRGHVEVINDSAAISPVDSFWVTRDLLSHTWDSLQQLRDENMATVLATLEGVLDKDEMAKNIKLGIPEDHTSILTTKGAFPKAVYKGHILKKGNNAEYEVSAYKLGHKLGIDVAVASEYENGMISCEIFTSDQESLVHMLEYLYPFDVPTYRDIYVKSLEVVSHSEALTRQMEKLFMFNYLCSNFDLHGENFGLIYCTESFEIMRVAPAFDFNSAFDVYEDVLMYDLDIVNNLARFINNNKELLPKLGQVETFLSTDPYLSKEQKSSIVDRADYLVSLVR